MASQSDSSTKGARYPSPGHRPGLRSQDHLRGLHARPILSRDGIGERVSVAISHDLHCADRVRGERSIGPSALRHDLGYRNPGRWPGLVYRPTFGAGPGATRGDDIATAGGFRLCRKWLQTLRALQVAEKLLFCVRARLPCRSKR
jgi:hypothetical protein